MAILGYISYVILVLLAITWALGVRLRLGLGVHSIIGPLFFTLSAIIIPISGIPFIHSLWLILLGYLIPLLVAYILPKSSFLSIPIIFFSSTYAGIIRIGIDKNKIRQAQTIAASEATENWTENQNQK